MANLKQIKTKIKSVKNLQKITKALEIVSTVKLQKTKGQADALKHYLIDLMAILAQVGEKIDLFDASQEQTSKNSEKNLIIVVTSERGLCGGLNSKLLRKVYAETAQSENNEFFIIGKKWLEFGKRAGRNIVGSLSAGDIYSEEDMLPLFSFFDVALDERSYKEIKLYFNYFKNTMTQLPTQSFLYPITKTSFEKLLKELELSYTISNQMDSKDLLVEPDIATYLKEIKRQIRNYAIASAVIQNKTGEHAARMIAMKSAKDNASGFVKSLTLSYNKARQGSITQEISEIVSAKIAIEG